MLDPKYLLQILKVLGESGYKGIAPSLIYSKVMPDELGGDRFKLVYHMDELWSNGLIRWRDDLRIARWGYTDFGYDEIDMVDAELVVTPAGSSLLSELSQDNGFNKFCLLLTRVGMKAGEKALSAILAAYATSQFG